MDENDDGLDAAVFASGDLTQQPHYIVTYKQLYSNGSVETIKKRLGRFASAASAKKHADRWYSMGGMEVIDLRPETKIENATHTTWRFLIRSLRISAAFAIAVVAWVLLTSSAQGISDTPLSQLTLGMIVPAVFKGALLLGIGLACWGLAFGEGPRER